MRPVLATPDGADGSGAYTKMSRSLAVAEYTSQAPDLFHLFLGELCPGMGFAFLQRRTPEVLASGHGLNVGRAHAGTVPAQMVGLQPFGDWPNQHLIGESVSENHSVVAVRPTTFHEMSVSISGSTPHPDPTNS